MTLFFPHTILFLFPLSFPTSKSQFLFSFSESQQYPSSFSLRRTRRRLLIPCFLYRSAAPSSCQRRLLVPSLPQPLTTSFHPIFSLIIIINLLPFSLSLSNIFIFLIACCNPLVADPVYDDSLANNKRILKKFVVSQFYPLKIKSS